MLKIEGLYDDPARYNDHDESPARWRVGPGRQRPDDESLTITRLASGVKDQNRVNVYVNEKFALSLDVQQVIDLRVKVGRVISAEFLQELRTASEFGKLYQRALEWALVRPRSVWETREYLKRRQARRVQMNRQREREEMKALPEIRTGTMELVVERLIEKGYVDDWKFAEYYVENRFTKKGVSKKRLRLELSKKGVSNEIIAMTLEQSSRDDDSELMKMIVKKARKYERDKLTAYLVRQGFAYHDVCEAIDRYEADNTEPE